MCFVFIATSCKTKRIINEPVKNPQYLVEVKKQFQVKWPKNKTINLVFHGHSVPTGYFKTPEVKTLLAYPHLVLKHLKKRYPYAVINVIVTGIGGEASNQGAFRFEDEVLNYKPDVLIIDYGLNDRRIGLDEARKSWEEMVERALKDNIPIILLTPSPDSRVDYSNSKNELFKHAEQIKAISAKYDLGLVDVYKVFEVFYDDKKVLKKYMSSVNHPNEKGHELIANELMKYFH